MQLKFKKRRGTVTVLVAVSLTAILAVAAIAIDGGVLLDDHRSVQSAADAAALAGADDLFTDWQTNTGSDPNGDAKNSALATASANGYNNDGTTNTVTVNIPPKSGNFSGKKGYVEVIITYNQPRRLSTIFGSGTIPVSARAVARGVPGNIGILILNKTMEGACEIDGIVNVLNNAQIFSNSNNTTSNDAASAGCTGSVYMASTAQLSVGGINVISSLVNNGTLTYTGGGGLSTYSTDMLDPLANIAEPSTSGLTTYSDQTITTNTTLNPGIYKNITIGSTGGGWGGGGGGWGGGGWGGGGGSSSPTVTLNPGIYYMQSGGSFSLNAGTLNGTGVMFYDALGNDQFMGMSNPNGGTVTITPPTPSSGGTWPTGTNSSTYNGISIWIPRSETDEVHIESSYNLQMEGTFYGQGAEFDIRPDGSTTTFDIGNYICAEAEWGQGFNSNGNSNGTINMHATTAAPNFRPALVE